MPSQALPASGPSSSSGVNNPSLPASSVVPGLTVSAEQALMDVQMDFNMEGVTIDEPPMPPLLDPSSFDNVDADMDPSDVALLRVLEDQVGEPDAAHGDHLPMEVCSWCTNRDFLGTPECTSCGKYHSKQHVYVNQDTQQLWVMPVTNVDHGAHGLIYKPANNRGNLNKSPETDSDQYRTLHKYLKATKNKTGHT